MPGVVPARRSHSSIEDDDDGIDNEHRSDSEDTTPPADQPNKRVRLDRDDGTHTNGTASSWTLSPPATATRRREPASNSHKDVADALASPPRYIMPEHKPGSIVRVTLTNFVTYTAASFYPGPALNMVIGPNGTGKSTLVCAICLGLGWGPKHLGRAKEPGEFVKHGSSEATIEIELKGQTGKRNPVFRRQIKREGNKSTYFLNDHPTSQNNVLTFAKQFGIQIDNLCNFLPQDRVVEFAGLSAIDRLDSTQRAAAPEYMVEWHQELKALRVEQKSGELLQAEVKQNLANLEGRQNLQRADVERMRERQTLVEKIAMLEKLRPFSAHAAIKIKHDEAKERKRLLQDELAMLKERDGPALRAVNAKLEYKGKIEKAVILQKTVLEKTSSSLEKCTKNREKVKDDIKGCKARRNAEANGEKERKKNLAVIQEKIDRFEILMKEPRIEFDAADYNERGREKERQGRDLQGEKDETVRGSAERKRLINEKTSQVDLAKKQLANLKTQSGKQYNKLQNMSKDTCAAWEWIQANKSQFKGQVYGPPLIECTITDKRYLAQVEALFRRKSESCAITCTDASDFNLLQHQLNSVMRLHDVYMRTANRPKTEWQPPISGEEELHRLGLEGWALNYVAGPDPVLSMLCSEAGLHRVGITSKDLSQTQHDALTNSAINMWITGKETYQVVRRAEYAGSSSTKVFQLSAPQLFTDQAVDPSVEQGIQQSIITLTSEIEDLTKQDNQVSSKLKDLQNQIDDLKRECDAIKKEKDQIQKAISDQNKIPSLLRAEEQRFEEQTVAEFAIRQKIMGIEEEENALILQKGQLSIDFANLVESLRKMHVKFVEARVMQIEANSDHEQLEMMNTAIKAERDRKEREFAEADKTVKALKDDYKQVLSSLRRAFDEDPNLKTYFESLPQEEQHRTPDDLNLEIETQNARLELLHEGDPRAIREFETRAKEIERLERQAAESEESLQTLGQSITEVRAKWEPELDALVAKISAAFASSFAKISCAGEVSVHKEGDGGRDFEGWAIHIHVKFRENEELSLLDSHRQSGGERAVSTIFYLMALQSLSRAPFRVVDEINQGMDPRNERVVHERMVDIACGSGGVRQLGDDGEELIDGREEEDVQGSQYFLITPKLLSDLKYKRGMKVHCIASGEYMPSNYKELDFKTLLKKAKEVFGGKNGFVGGVGA